MGHIVLAAPSISRFQLHHRLRRDLLRRGHRVSILCIDRCRFTFWREQVSDVDLIEPGNGEACPPALRDTIAAMVSSRPEQRRQQGRWQQLLPTTLRWLEREQPDLVLFHAERTLATACMQFAARTAGSRVLWTGDGLLPHTMQIDERGLDGDASSRRWQAEQFAVVTPDDELLQASLGHALALGQPLALPRHVVQVPRLRRRLWDAWHYALSARFHAASAALHGFRAALASEPPDPPPSRLLDLRAPFLALLLQADDDPRVRHDANDAPDTRTLLERTLAAANLLGHDTQVVVALPERIDSRQLDVTSLVGAGAKRIRIVSHRDAGAIAATAAATVTINHPAAAVALLSGTPVVHLGRALWELAGVTNRTNLADLPTSLATALTQEQSELRRSFLTWLLQHGHVWCSATAPNHNGMLGLMQSM